MRDVRRCGSSISWEMLFFDLSRVSRIIANCEGSSRSLLHSSKYSLSCELSNESQAGNSLEVTARTPNDDVVLSPPPPPDVPRRFEVDPSRGVFSKEVFLSNRSEREPRLGAHVRDVPRTLFSAASVSKGKAIGRREETGRECVFREACQLAVDYATRRTARHPVTPGHTDQRPHAARKRLSPRSRHVGARRRRVR